MQGIEADERVIGSDQPSQPLQRDGADRRLWGTPYRTIRRKGRDGASEVVVAEEVGSGRQVEVTLFALDDVLEAGSATAVVDQQRALGDRVRLEGEVLARLRHSNVAAVIDAGQTPDGRPYFVTEPLADGRTAMELLAGGPLPVPEAVSLTLEVLAALEAAHALGVVHRDVKPANVLVAQQQGSRVVKLTGFGIAKVVAAAADGPAALVLSTASGQLLGAPRYLSPEAILSGPVDGRSDVYQVGLLLHELISGAPPFQTDGSVRGWLEAHLVGEPTPLVAPDVPAALSQVVAKALAKRPEDRWASAADLAAAIRRAASGDLDAADRAALTQLGAGGTELLDRGELTALLAAVPTDVMATGPGGPTEADDPATLELPQPDGLAGREGEATAELPQPSGMRDPNAPATLPWPQPKALVRFVPLVGSTTAGLGVSGGF